MKLYFHPAACSDRAKRFCAGKALPSWSKVNEAFAGFAHAVKDQPFVAV
jgi:hypothetical protein